MDSIVTVAKVRAEVARSVAKNLAVNTVEALGAMLDGRGDSGLDSKMKRRYDTMRLKLFLKYAMVDHEILLSRAHRNDAYERT